MYENELETKESNVETKNQINHNIMSTCMPTTTFDDIGRMPKVVKQTGAQGARFLRLCASDLKYLNVDNLLQGTCTYQSY